MPRLMICLLSLVLLPNLAWSAEPVVTLEQSPASVKVLIGEDVFTVFHYGADRRKPFFLPVTGPGGFELLQKGVAEEKAGSIGRKVVVASESVVLKTPTGNGATVQYGDILEIGSLSGNQLQLAGKQEWISRSDIAPLAAVVVRLINDDPSPSKDRVTGDKYDHPHHKGIWFSVDEINEHRHWMEGSLVRTQSVELKKSGTSAAELHFVNHWLDKKEQPLLIETTTVTITSDRLLIYDTVLAPAEDQVHIGDTKEGMLAIRLMGTMREMAGGGPVINSNGLKTSAKGWGKTAAWVNYDGPIDGHVFGVTLMDARENPWPSRYHVRDYGLFAVNPFGAGAYTAGTADVQPKHDRTLKQGETLHFKFGVWIHGPNVTIDQIQQVYNRL